MKVDPNTLEVHPAADIFPVMDEIAFNALRDDIKANGQIEAIRTWSDGVTVIDGRHRRRACIELGIKCETRGWGGPESEIVSFVVSANLRRRHLSESQRAMVAAKLANLPEGRPRETAGIQAVSQAAAADLLNVSRASVQEAKRIREAAPELAQKVEAGEVTLHAAARQLAERQNKEALVRPVELTISGLTRGDFQDFAHEIADNSVELIFTDPPYSKDSLPLYERSAEEAARILKPGGSMICYVGQVLLPDALVAMSKHLRYWWTAACVHEGGEQMLQKLGIRCGWKPMMWFVKGTRGDVSNVLRDTVSGAREKDAHQWQQAEAEAAYFIEKLCSPSGLVVDFFAGGGTTCIASERLGRKWIAFENNATHYNSAKARINALRVVA